MEGFQMVNLVEFQEPPFSQFLFPPSHGEKIVVTQLLTPTKPLKFGSDPKSSFFKNPGHFPGLQQKITFWGDKNMEIFQVFCD